MFRIALISLLLGIVLLSGAASAVDWWDPSYSYRYEIISNRTTPGDINVKDTADPDIWTLNATGTETLYLYCTVSGCGSGQLAVGNATSQKAWENGTHNNTGNSPSSVWDNLYYVFHMNHANIVDSTTNNYNGTATGMTDAANLESGFFGNYLSFAGDTDYITVSGTNNGGHYTIAFWILIPSGDSNTGYILSKGDTNAGAANHNYAIVTEPGALLNFYNGDGSGYCNLVSSAYINTGTWWHVALTMNDTSNSLKWYINGVVNETGACTRTPEDDGSLYINSYRVPDGATGVTMNLTELRLYNYELSASEIADLYNAGIGAQNHLGSEEAYPTASDNITLTLGVDPSTLYNLTDANFSISYLENSSLASNITVNFTVNGVNITDNLYNFYNVTSNTTVYFYVEAANYTKHDNITLYVNLTTFGDEAANDTLTKEIQNSQPGAASIAWDPVSAIIGDSFNASGSSSDDDQDILTYYYRYGWNNGTNITNWTTDIRLTVNATNENDTFRVYVLADDGEVNSTANYTDLNVTSLIILWPVQGGEYYGKTFNYSFTLVADAFQPCYEIIDNTSYSLGNITSGEHNNSRYVWYGNHTYNVTCHSLRDSSLVYYKNVTYSNFYANWTISIMTENDWDVPLNISDANLSIIIKCEGGETYVYNFTGTEISGVNPPCDVETVSAQVNYATDSYLRERMPPCEGTCDVEMYMVDALIYTVLQIPIYMSDFLYYDSKIELYKMSGGEHYTIAEGYFDVEHKYVTYLTKDNTYLIRLTQDGEVRDIGFLYAATATAQYLSLSQITLEPSIRLISDNILMAAAFDNESAPLSTLRVQYLDYINMTESVRVQIFTDINNTAWYDNTITGSSNFTISINDVNTSYRYSVVFTVEHAVLGNSPIPYTVGVGIPSAVDFGLPEDMAWLYGAFGFVIMLFTAWVMTPEMRLPGYLLLLAELGIFSLISWFTFPAETLMLFVAFLVSGIIYEIRHRGIT